MATSHEKSGKTGFCQPTAAVPPPYSLIPADSLRQKLCSNWIQHGGRWWWRWEKGPSSEEPISLKEGDDGNGRQGGGGDGESFLVKENKLIARIYLQERRGPRWSEQQVSGLRVCSDFSPSFTVIVLWLLSSLQDLRESLAETMKKQQMPRPRRTRLCFRQCFSLSPVIRGICWRTGPSALMTR